MLTLRVNDETENVPREIYLRALSVNSFDSQKSIFVLNLTEVRCFPFLILLILSTIVSFRVQSPENDRNKISYWIETLKLSVRLSYDTNALFHLNN